ncbi:hypothetical protein OIT44_03960 [Weissella ceti]|uniref:Uncharacterized protein n=1 Tax=Weissella ceti TaxID=759620 RepID=A0ABT3E4R5_9LACO|nr:hypothetical protein [Weissella ceti]MCW0953229.1 hypothetical protein [Weissella ceti]QVK12745.1 hypothetical protein KHQ31_03720 [Weissella ceti]
MVAIVPQEHWDRVGIVLGKIKAAQLKEKDVYLNFTSKSTWESVTKGRASEKTTNKILGNAERYVDAILKERNSKLSSYL